MFACKFHEFLSALIELAGVDKMDICKAMLSKILSQRLPFNDGTAAIPWQYLVLLALVGERWLRKCNLTSPYPPSFPILPGKYRRYQTSLCFVLCHPSCHTGPKQHRYRHIQMFLGREAVICFLDRDAIWESKKWLEAKCRIIRVGDKCERLAMAW